MEDETPKAPPRSSLLFAMGELTSEVRNAKDEQGRQREAIDSLPLKVASAIEPRLVSMTAALALLDTRVSKVEQKQWYFAGVIAVVVYAADKVWPIISAQITPHK
ncbi:MAG: hypothetical protein WA154_12900 [Moraxellaceae bacterium]